jgi:hypothetical protein
MEKEEGKKGDSVNFSKMGDILRKRQILEGNHRKIFLPIDFP